MGKFDPPDGQLRERQIYLGPKGHRYVKAEELLRDPTTLKRLESADRLAHRLGLTGHQNGRRDRS